MRNAMATVVAVALIGLLSSLITVVFEKESDGVITKFVYQDTNTTNKCTSSEPNIIFTDKEW